MRLTMADTPMGADPVQNQPTPPSGACSPLPSPPASANFGTVRLYSCTTTTARGNILQIDTTGTTMTARGNILQIYILQIDADRAFSFKKLLVSGFRTLATNGACHETSVTQFVQVKLTGAHGMVSCGAR
eukprot:SAG25_NODE_392_length_8604_cov_13.605879_9_plen_130_part_00